MARHAQALHAVQLNLLRGQAETIARTRATLRAQEELHQVMLRLSCPEAAGPIVFFPKDGLAEYDTVEAPALAE